MRPYSTVRATGAGARSCGLALIALLATAPAALAASPSPTPGGVGDPRSSGQGPGLVGDPLLAIGLVVVLGILAMGATLLYVRATGGPRAG